MSTDEYVEQLEQQLKLKDKELRELNQARDEICASGQEDYIGIIRNKNLELRLKDKMIELMCNDLTSTVHVDGSWEGSPPPHPYTQYQYYKQQALAELRGE